MVKRHDEDRNIYRKPVRHLINAAWLLYLGWMIYNTARNSLSDMGAWANVAMASMFFALWYGGTRNLKS